MKEINKIALAAALVTALTNSAFADCGGSDSHRFYVGIEGGMSVPMQNSFEVKEKILGKNQTIKGTLNKTKTFGGFVGYEFYPGISVELSYQKKPFYKSSISTPEITIPAYKRPVGVLPSAKMKSGTADMKLSSELYMLGVVYALDKVGMFTPFVGIDLGVAKVRNTAATIMVENPYKNLPAVLNTMAASGYKVSEKVGTLEFKKKTMYAPAMQLSLGATTQEILPNIQLFGAVRAQIIKDVKLKYDMVNFLTGDKTPGRFKKTIGVTEINFGITYNIPVSK